MRNFLQIGTADTLPLLHALTLQPDLWNAVPVRTTYPGSAHRDASDILLRFNRLDADAEAMFAEHEVSNLPPLAALPQARPLIFDLMRRVEGERLGRVVITRLPPGGEIKPHADEGDYAAYYSRYHVMLQNPSDSWFRCGGEDLYMAPGTVWWFNSGLPHAVYNRGDADRITMIVDIRSSCANN